MAHYYRTGWTEPLLKLDYASTSNVTSSVGACEVVVFYSTGLEPQLRKLYDFTRKSFKSYVTSNRERAQEQKQEQEQKEEHRRQRDEGLRMDQYYSVGGLEPPLRLEYALVVRGI